MEDSEGGFADDTGIHAWTKEVLERKMEILFEVFKEYGLSMNIKRRKPWSGTGAKRKKANTPNRL